MRGERVTVAPGYRPNWTAGIEFIDGEIILILHVDHTYALQDAASDLVAEISEVDMSMVRSYHVHVEHD